MTIQVVTYHSVNAKPDQQWSGCCVLPSGQRLEIWFCAGSEQGVIDRARAFYEREKARQDRLYGSTVAAADNDEAEVNAAGPSREQVFTGKVWMLNRETGERARVSPGEVGSYIARGFNKAGPRSK